MIERQTREILGESILPVLLDNTAEAHRLSSRIFRRFGIVSLICGKPHLCDWFDVSSQTLRLPTTACERLRVEELLALGESYDDVLLLLIPCSHTARTTVARYATVLESRFILSDTDAIFSSSPLTDIAHRLRTDTPIL